MLHISVLVHSRSAKDGEFPYQITIRNTTDKYICDGTIIGRQWILTAAHCIYGRSKSSLMIVAGTNQLKLNDDPIIYLIDEIIPFRAYTPTSNRCDIALIRITGYIEFDRYVNKIGLQPTKPNLNSTIATLNSWNVPINGDTRVEKTLQTSSLRMIDNDQCRSLYPRLMLTTTHLCMESLDDPNVCMANGGSPLVANGRLIAIHSFGISCTGRHNLFTWIPSYYNWIIRHTGSL